MEGYFAAALVLPVWRPILGGLTGFLGISPEFLGLMALYPLPKRYAVFNLLIVSVLFNAHRNIGSYPVINGIGTSNKSLSAIVMFIALYIGFGKYGRQEDFI